MKNPIKKFIEAEGLSTNEIAKKLNMQQPTVYRHAYQDYTMSYVSMEAYAQAGISFEDLRKWNQKLFAHKKQDHIDQGGKDVPGGKPPGGEDP